ncbi:hypothetical protein C8R45DRAFT_1207603 [Mycena sanguinolenta]|nr:hypothetical protein C8R45DRAFT_1207603 [Mycena sanguinolenta]
MPASAHELRRRIEQISSDINRQEELLKRLQQTRNQLQRQLNQLVDPIARLPFEISSEIFLRTLDPFTKPASSQTPMLFLNVCSTWNAIAVSTSALWSSIGIDFPCGFAFWMRVLPRWLARARNCPLSIRFGGDFHHWNLEVSDLVWKHGGQLKHLEIANDNDEDDEDTDNDLFMVDIFGGTSPESMPLLESLTIRGLTGEQAFFGRQILELLRQMPNITKFLMEPLIDLPSKDLVVPTLRQLSFGDSEDSHDEILNYLSLPALETLSVPMHFLVGEELFRFIKRSSPPLQELIVAWEHVTTAVHLLECFHLIPTLVRLQMLGPNTSVMANLFTALAGPSPLLPKLNSFIVFNPGHISEVSWSMLVRALFSRRKNLRIVAVKDVDVPKAADVLAALGELVLGGMQIYIGTKTTNFAAPGFPTDVLDFPARWELS